jgi:hypothetical protein
MVQTRLGTKADITGILTLQEPNLVSNMTEAQKVNGFVTTPLTVPMLERMIGERGVFVGENEIGQIVAYVIAGDWDFYRQWPIFDYMVSRFPTLNFQGREITVQNSFQYGPICIDHQYRGTGLMKTIFETMRLELVKRYPISITFINQTNIRSMKAHQKIGWELVDEFSFETGNFAGLGFDMGC